MKEEQKSPPPMLSIGCPSTLGNWYELTAALFGEDSAATKFVKDKLDRQGADQPVLSDESQLLLVLMEINRAGKEEA